MGDGRPASGEEAIEAITWAYFVTSFTAEFHYENEVQHFGLGVSGSPSDDRDHGGDHCQV